MRSLFENKRLILLLAALALGALTVLAISLNEIPFREGQRFVREEADAAPIVPAEVEEVWVEIPLWQQLVVWILLVLMVILIGLLLSPEMRKRMFLLLIRVAFTFWAIYFLFKNYGDQLFGFNLQRPDGDPLSDESVVPLPLFEPPQVSPAFSYLISFAFALILLAVIWGLYRGWQKYVALNKIKPLDEIAKIARSSLKDLSSGRNSSDVIINCYLRMSDVVSNKRQLQRELAMTPHEFALRLEQAGLPGDAVTRLTRLFEGVRYGDRKSGPKDVNEAVSCLKTILQYCGEPV
ncbi:MAG TPA: DUF4129 domain-containing protein [Anaerolineales bacterium]|nr:DUF4129 domain-containing protein [Anaerolineales bacterium]